MNIDELKEKIEELEQFNEELRIDNKSLKSEVDDFNYDLSEREQVSEVAFKAGYSDGFIYGMETNIACLHHIDKSWLNFKIKERI